MRSYTKCITFLGFQGIFRILTKSWKSTLRFRFVLSSLSKLDDLKFYFIWIINFFYLYVIYWGKMVLLFIFLWKSRTKQISPWRNLVRGFQQQKRLGFLGFQCLFPIPLLVWTLYSYWEWWSYFYMQPQTTNAPPLTRWQCRWVISGFRRAGWLVAGWGLAARWE